MPSNRYVLDAESHALGQRELLPVIDRVGSPAHVRFPGIRARLASAPRFLLAAERPAYLGSGRPDIDVGDPAVGACRYAVCGSRRAIQLHNAVGAGLASSIFTLDMREDHKVKIRLLQTVAEERYRLKGRMRVAARACEQRERSGPVERHRHGGFSRLPRAQAGCR